MKGIGGKRMKKIIEKSVSGIRTIRFYNETIRKNEEIDPVCRPSVDAQGHLCLYNKDSAQRSIRPGCILEINGSKDLSGFIEGKED